MSERCPRCTKPVNFAEQVLAFGKTYHKLCLKCGECNQMLDSLSCSDHEGEVFCKACYGKKFVPKGYGFAGGASGLSMDTGKAFQVTREDTSSYSQALATSLLTNKGWTISVEKESIVFSKQKQDAQKPTPMGQGISIMKPKFPKYARLSERQESFNKASSPWPQDAPVGVEKLVEAGLMYTGVGDSVRCYHCGGTLRNWEAGDDPMEEHAKWYPTCQQVLIAKSKTYIKKVKAGESQKADKVIERKEPEMKTGDPLTVSLQTLAEFKYSESEAKIVLNIFKKRNGPNAQYKAGDLVSILMEIEDDPDVMNECNDNSDPTASQVEPTTQDAEDIDDIEALEEENKKMKEAISCKICKDREVDTVFRFCGHRVVCWDCASLLETCNICGDKLEDKINIDQKP